MLVGYLWNCGQNIASILEKWTRMAILFALFERPDGVISSNFLLTIQIQTPKSQKDKVNLLVFWGRFMGGKWA